MRTSKILKRIYYKIRNEINKYSGKTYYGNRKKTIIFIFGTGRSGSESIIKTLNKHSKIIGFHEEIRSLIKMSTEYETYPEQQRLIEKEFKKILDYKIYPAQNGELVVHSDQRLWNFIPFLNIYFKNAKFVLMVREPISCIKSMLARHWFFDNEYPSINRHRWAQYRLLGWMTGIISKNQWEAMNVEERAAWYWCHINGSVKEELQKLPKQKYFILETERMGERLKSLQTFLMIEEQKIEVIVSNKRKAAHNITFDSLNDEKIKTALKKVEKIKKIYSDLHSLQNKI